jgi:hypothetical protein
MAIADAPTLPSFTPVWEGSRLGVGMMAKAKGDLAPLLTIN